MYMKLEHRYFNKFNSNVLVSKYGNKFNLSIIAGFVSSSGTRFRNSIIRKPLFKGNGSVLRTVLKLGTISFENWVS